MSTAVSDGGHNRKVKYCAILQNLSIEQENDNNDERKEKNADAIQEVQSLLARDGVKESVRHPDESNVDSRVLKVASELGISSSESVDGTENKYDKHELALLIKKNPSFWAFTFPREVPVISSLHGTFAPTPPDQRPRAPARKVERQQATTLKAPENVDNRTSRRVSLRQLKVLCDFLTAHPEVAMAYNRSQRDKSYAETKWAELTDILNAEGLGVHKDWRGWSKYWVDYKAKLKIKVSGLRSSLRQTGGTSTEKEFSDLEKRFLNILGEDLSQGLTGVRVERLPEPPSSIEQSIALGDNVQTEDDTACSLPVQVEYSLPAHSVHRPDHAIETPRSQTPPDRERAARRRRRDSVMTQESARRSLTNATQVRAEAAMRSAQAMEAIARSIGGLENTLLRIERMLSAVLPTSIGPENSS